MLPSFCFFFFCPCCSHKSNDLLRNIAELLVLSHKTNTPLLLFWTDVFLSLLLWLCYTLPSLLIFLIFLTPCTGLKFSLLCWLMKLSFPCHRSLLPRQWRYTDKPFAFVLELVFCFDTVCIISHWKPLLLYAWKNPLTWHWQRKQSLKRKKKNPTLI